MDKAATKNHIFHWEGRDKTGRRTNGEMTSSTIVLAKAQLRKQGIMPTKIRKKSKPIFSSTNGSIKPADIAIFSRQLATLIKAGVPLVQAFDIVGESLEKTRMRELVLSIKNDVASGNSFASVLRKHPNYFDDLFCNLVAAGEQSGSLETMLARIATYKEKTEALKAKIKKALFYPTTVIVIALLLTGLILVKVVPQFENIFRSFGAELPTMTQIVVNLSEWLQSWWLVLLLVVTSLVILGVRAKRKSERFSHALERFILKVPIIGKIIHKAAIARFARTLSTTFAAGVPLVEALESVAGATGNIVYVNALQRIKEDISTGQQLNFAMRSSGLFPVMVVQMVAIGEESGALDDMLEKVAIFYEEEVSNSVDNLTSLIEPMVMVLLGLLIGGLVIAMYLPIFRMATVL